MSFPENFPDDCFFNIFKFCYLNENITVNRLVIKQTKNILDKAVVEYLKDENYFSETTAGRSFNYLCTFYAKYFAKASIINLKNRTYLNHVNFTKLSDSCKDINKLCMPNFICSKVTDSETKNENIFVNGQRLEYLISSFPKVAEVDVSEIVLTYKDISVLRSSCPNLKKLIAKNLIYVHSDSSTKTLDHFPKLEESIYFNIEKLKIINDNSVEGLDALSVAIASDSDIDYILRNMRKISSIALLYECTEITLKKLSELLLKTKNLNHLILNTFLENLLKNKENLLGVKSFLETEVSLNSASLVIDTNFLNYYETLCCLNMFAKLKTLNIGLSDNTLKHKDIIKFISSNLQHIENLSFCYKFPGLFELKTDFQNSLIKALESGGFQNLRTLSFDYHPMDDQFNKEEKTESVRSFYDKFKLVSKNLPKLSMYCSILDENEQSQGIEEYSGNYADILSKNKTSEDRKGCTIN